MTNKQKIAFIGPWNNNLGFANQELSYLKDNYPALPVIIHIGDFGNDPNFYANISGILGNTHLMLVGGPNDIPPNNSSGTPTKGLIPVTKNITWVSGGSTLVINKTLSILTLGGGYNPHNLASPILDAKALQGIFTKNNNPNIIISYDHPTRATVDKTLTDAQQGYQQIHINNVRDAYSYFQPLMSIYVSPDGKYNDEAINHPRAIEKADGSIHTHQQPSYIIGLGNDQGSIAHNHIILDVPATM